MAVLFVAFLSQAANPNPDPYDFQMFVVDDQKIPDALNYRKDWARLTGFEHSGLHWGQFVIVYTNVGEKTYRHNYLQYASWFDDPDDEDNIPSYDSYPVGTVLLKENFSVKNGKPDTPLTIAAMIKRASGFDPKGGDWEYIQLDVDGKVLLKGSSRQPEVHKNCGECHINVSDRDFVFANFYSNIKAP